MTAGRALFWGLLLALLACGTSGRASSAVKGLEGQEGPHRALLENSSTAGVPPPPFQASARCRCAQEGVYGRDCEPPVASSHSVQTRGAGGRPCTAASHWPHPASCHCCVLLQVVITCDQPGPTTSSPLPLWTVDFGRPLQQANPLSLFRVAGVYRCAPGTLHTSHMSAAGSTAPLLKPLLGNKGARIVRTRQPNSQPLPCCSAGGIACAAAACAPVPLPLSECALPARCPAPRLQRGCGLPAWAGPALRAGLCGHPRPADHAAADGACGCGHGCGGWRTQCGGGHHAGLPASAVRYATQAGIKGADGGGERTVRFYSSLPHLLPAVLQGYPCLVPMHVWCARWWLCHRCYAHASAAPLHGLLNLYPPVSCAASGLSWLGAASSAAFGGTMALSFATGLMGGAGGVGMGALGFAGYAQTFYYSGSLPLSNMPEVGGSDAAARQNATARSLSGSSGVSQQPAGLQQEGQRLQHFLCSAGA